MEVTIWQRWNPKTGAWEHNHVEDGWVEESSPNPRCESQKKSWEKATWKKIKAKMLKGKIERRETW